MSAVVVKKNKWENQYIKKKFRRKGLDSSGRYYQKATKHSNSPNIWHHHHSSGKRNKRVLNMIDSKAICNNLPKNYYDSNDCNDNITNFSVKYNIIQIWVCNICTYRNIERLDHCAMCDNPYSLNKTTKINNNESNQLNGQNTTLNDFISIKIKNKYNLNYDKTHKISNDYFWDNSHENRHDGEEDYIPLHTHRMNKTKKNKQKLNALINNGEYGIIPKDVKHTIFKSKMLQKHLPKLKAIRHLLQYHHLNIIIKCLVTDYWLNKLETINNVQFVYTKSIQNWNHKDEVTTSTNYKDKMEDLYKAQDGIIKHCGIDILFCGFIRRQNILIPSDITYLFLLYTGIGMFDKLIPYKINKKYNNNIDHFYLQRNDTINYSYSLNDAQKWLIHCVSEIYLCAILKSAADGTAYAIYPYHKYSEIIPILSIKTNSMTHLSSTRRCSGYSGIWWKRYSTNNEYNNKMINYHEYCPKWSIDVLKCEKIQISKSDVKKYRKSNHVKKLRE